MLVFQLQRLRIRDDWSCRMPVEALAESRDLPVRSLKRSQERLDERIRQAFPRSRTRNSFGGAGFGAYGRFGAHLTLRRLRPPPHPLGWTDFARSDSAAIADRLREDVPAGKESAAP